ncbi:hypothetical protein CR513_12766, partial [Mucuna pruriens]
MHPTALEALIQYYDLPVRCFTFRDFQIAPTLEEYKCLLGGRPPQYFHQDQPPYWAMIAKLLRVSEVEMAKVKRSRNDLEGLSRVYLEERLLQLREEDEWPAVINILGLLLYWILLFPHVENYIDLAVVEVFLAKKDKGENPTMAILANTYYTLNYYSKQKEGSLRCSTPLLYLWLTSHLFHYKSKTECLMEDFKWSWIITMSKEHWVRQLSEASERTICWYPPWNERENMITRYRGYPNIPLLGIQGAINYNPELVSRQAGYPMIRAPLEEVMTPFVLHRLEAYRGEYHRKI